MHAPLSRASRWFVALSCLTVLSARAQEPTPESVSTPQPAPAEPAPALPQPPSLPPALRIPTLVASGLAELGCSVADAVTHEGRYYAVCGQGNVWVIQAAEGSLQVVARHRVGGMVRSLFVQSSRVWVSSAHETAQPLEDAPLESANVTASAGAPVVVPSAKEEPEPGSFGVPGGIVLSRRDQGVVVSIGKGQGLRIGEHVEIYRVDDGGADKSADDEGDFEAQEQTVLIGKTVAVSATRAQIVVGFGEFAELGMRARKTTLPLTARLVAPQRMGKLLILEGSVRPFLPVDELGFALSGDLAATWLPERDLYARLEVRPLGALLSRKGHDAGVFGAYASGGYDQTYFALGLGLGTLYFGQNTEIREDQLFLNHTDSKLTLSVLQHVRLGSRDGLHFESSSAVRLDLHSWSFGWFEGSVQIPVSSRSWFLLRSSGGTDPGYVYTELGFRRLVRGNGAGGSLFVRPSAGFSGISSPEHSGDFVLGPMLGLHLEARLAR